MNRKKIKKLLARKHDEFCESITDKGVRKLVQENGFITGGSIVSMLCNETVKDFDYYFTNKETVLAVARYYVKQFIEANPATPVKPLVRESKDGRIEVYIKSKGAASESEDARYKYFESQQEGDGEEYIKQMAAALDAADDAEEDKVEAEKPAYRPVFMSSNAVTLSNKVQLVLRFYGSPEEVHKNYDFVHCMCYWTAADNKLVLPPAALESILTRQLSYMGSLYPVCSVIRTRKFLLRGWFINAGQYLKMCFQCSQLDLTDVDVLEDQLTGVDAAYFIEIIEYCRSRMEKDSEFKITMPYLASIIDKIF